MSRHVQQITTCHIVYLYPTSCPSPALVLILAYVRSFHIFHALYLIELQTDLFLLQMVVMCLPQISCTLTNFDRDFHATCGFFEGDWPLVGNQGHRGEMGGILENVWSRTEEVRVSCTRQKVCMLSLYLTSLTKVVNRSRYILWCMEKYRSGLPVENFSHEPRPKKTIRG
jgi:hypothetical protein